MTSNPYQAYPTSAAGQYSQLIEPPAVQTVAAGPLRQRRVTVGFRLILAIPHLFVLFFLDIAGSVVAFLGWWGALFTGRLPGFAITYLSGLARWNARVYGYMYLLTDAYPPFTFDDDPAYPVRVAIPEPQRLNRFAVFFRLILGTWAYIVVSVVASGANTIALFIVWLITLVNGEVPAPLHLAYTAVLRYQTRYYCYLGMLTPAYPWKLFGDDPAVPGPMPGAPMAGAAAAGAPREDPTKVMPPEGAAGYETAGAADADAPTQTAWGTPSGYGTPPGYDIPAGFGAWPGYGTRESVYGMPGGYAPAQPGGPAGDWRLVLPQSSKNLLIVFIVLGVLFNVGTQVWSAALRSHGLSSVFAVTDWNIADNALNANITSWNTTTQACDQNLTCVTRADGRAASYLAAFASQVKAISMPSAAAPAAADVIADATKSAHDLTTLSHAKSVAQYESEAGSTGLRPDLDRLQTDIGRVAKALDNS